MKITGKFRAPTIDLVEYEKKLQRYVAEQAAYAAFQYLNAVTQMVPVWSGASRATFLKLAEAINWSLSINPVTSSRIALGEGSSEGKINVEGVRATFIYRTSLRHLVFNEENNANVMSEHGYKLHLRQPGPYHFQAVGEKSFEAAAKHVTPLLPDVKAGRVVRA